MTGGITEENLKRGHSKCIIVSHRLTIPLSRRRRRWCDVISAVTTPCGPFLQQNVKSSSNFSYDSYSNSGQKLLLIHPSNR